MKYTKEDFASFQEVFAIKSGDFVAKRVYLGVYTGKFSFIPLRRKWTWAGQKKKIIK